MTSTSLVDLTVTHHYTPPAERVFDAWFDTSHVASWFFAGPTGTVVRVAIDPRAGGTFLVVDQREGKDVPHYGTYVEIERPRRIVFDFSVMSPTDQITRVAIDIAPAASGCDLTLTHESIPAEHADRARAGWTRMLEGLEHALSAAN